MTMKLLEFKGRRQYLFAGDHEEMDENRAGHAAFENAAAIPDVPPSVRTRTQRKTLLLISDDTGLGISLGNAADLADLAFEQAKDPFAAIRLTETEHPAVVFVDLDMPGLDGWRAAEHFLFEENGPPMVLLTGRTGNFDLGTAIRAGMVVDKSSRPGELLGKLSRLLARNEVEQGDCRTGQRLMIRWLRPYEWTFPGTPAIRNWGIND